MEKTFQFQNKQQVIRGILHIPDAEVVDKKTAVILLHGWGTYRIGPHRILVDAARKFTENGFTCLRFDFRGRGESEGATAATTLLSMIADAEAAVKVILARTSVKQVILLGLCSGGEVAVGTAMSHPAITGLILWSTPLLGRQAQADIPADFKKTAHFAKSYWAKLFNRESWRKILRLQLNFRVIFKILFGHFFKTPPCPVKEVELLERFRFFPGRALFVYGGNDPEAATAEKAYSVICRTHNIASEFHTIAEANHNFYSLAWREELLKKTCKWLQMFDEQHTNK